MVWVPPSKSVMPVWYDAVATPFTSNSGTVASVAEPSMNVTLPVGSPDRPVIGTTVAVNVTAWPKIDGFGTALVMVLTVSPSIRWRVSVFTAAELSMVAWNSRPPRTSLVTSPAMWLPKLPEIVPVLWMMMNESRIAGV